MVVLDLGLGEKKNMAEIRELIKGDSVYNNLTKEQEEEMKNKLLSFHDVKKRGPCTTNKSSAQDYRRVCGNMNDEVSASPPPCLICSLFSRSPPSRNKLVPLSSPSSAACILKTPLSPTGLLPKMQWTSHGMCLGMVRGMWHISWSNGLAQKPKVRSGVFTKLLLIFPLLQAHNPDSLKDMKIECSRIINGTLSMHAAFPYITIC